MVPSDFCICLDLGLGLVRCRRRPCGVQPAQNTESPAQVRFREGWPPYGTSQVQKGPLPHLFSCTNLEFILQYNGASGLKTALPEAVTKPCCTISQVSQAVRQSLLREAGRLTPQEQHQVPHTLGFQHPDPTTGPWSLPHPPCNSPSDKHVVMLMGRGPRALIQAGLPFCWLYCFKGHQSLVALLEE